MIDPHTLAGIVHEAAWGAAKATRSFHNVVISSTDGLGPNGSGIECSGTLGDYEGTLDNISTFNGTYLAPTQQVMMIAPMNNLQASAAFAFTPYIDGELTETVF